MVVHVSTLMVEQYVTVRQDLVVIIVKQTVHVTMAVPVSMYQEDTRVPVHFITQEDSVNMILALANSVLKMHVV